MRAHVTRSPEEICMLRAIYGISVEGRSGLSAVCVPGMEQSKETKQARNGTRNMQDHLWYLGLVLRSGS